ncbi:hypothetical protein [Burkholderia lata]|uniref:Uncharacterized protein n=1 Tax=Burkholderia lata (strain ATCC 17760 / DSM 23089 / LMG 22485 / NCIMB 9086 / R18194 / 383) TaxID=482957 RepID=A0A6P2RU50_BURL3|nr:hypothetical protein [Burkholderia lata]VWC36832.1 hypothetical protein BLA6863_06746 [Burkholderia lata]
MTMFSGFNYGGTFPTQRSMALVPFLTLTTSGPKIVPIEFTPLESAATSAANVFWKAITVGYGAPADYAIHWLLNGAALNPPQMNDLKRLAHARATAISRAYACTVLPSGAAALVPRDIYSLIESTERTGTSYLMGCTVAALCAPEAIKWQLGGSPTGIDYLFHASLLKAATKAGMPVVVNSKGQGSIDFLGFDTQFHLHVIEAKGSGGAISYQQIGGGLDQCDDVVDITLAPGIDVAPRTKSVSAAYVDANAVNCMGLPVGHCVRAVVIGLPLAAASTQPAPAAPVAREKVLRESVARLLALQAIGAWAFVTATTSASKSSGDWARFRFVPDTDIAEPVHLAMRKTIVEMVEASYQRMRGQVANARPRRHAQDMLKVTLTDLGIDLMRAMSDTPVAPDGLSFSGADPWVAVQM